MQTLQQTMDAYISQLTEAPAFKSELLLSGEQCLEAFTQYLVHYSDLFQEPEMADGADFSDWEEGLEEHMINLLEGDVEPSGDLGMLPLGALDPEHLRDFLGWFVLRETGDGALIKAYAETLKGWIEFIRSRGWWSQSEYLGFAEILNDVAPEAERTARVSQVLFHYVRSGTGVPPRLRGQRFSRFVEGHGRVSEVGEAYLRFNFENRGEEVGPVLLPRVIVDLIAIGDVFDIELGLRGDSWVMVDVGPVYPRCVYVEVEEYQGLEKLS
ncbi:MAG: hypothetical protein ACE5E3_03775 [Mariprofundus sp.]